ncbi:MAG: type IV toxin-antitoxin system AbiEi family antitoxin domain-containing protein, partial [Cylindrospermopsis raciborskii PAMP2012]
MNKGKVAETASERAVRLIKKKGTTIIRTAQALQVGIHPRTLYQLRDNGVLEQVSRGVYRLSEQPYFSQPDLVTVALRIPKGIICLVSALAFHELTTQIPHTVSIALAKGAQSPRIDYPPVSVHRFSGASLKTGIEVYEIDEVPIRIYSAEKTLADCFKFRNKLGMDVVLEALKLYKTRKK